MPPTPKKKVGPRSRAYRAARWAYQPLKTLKSSARASYWNVRSAAAVKQYLAGDGFKGLQIGCGTFPLAGWLNSDIPPNPKMDLFVDITKRLPFPDASLDAIYGAEVIEHVEEPDARRFLAETRRVLKPTGVLRLTTPDLAEICRLFLRIHPDATIEQFGRIWLEDLFTPERWVNGQFRHHGHRHIWSRPEMSAALAEAGYADVQWCKPHETLSGMPQLERLENRYGKDAAPWLFARTMILEARNK